MSTVLAIVAGSLVGAVFMALHSAQGSRLGVPQMIQARAQFGMYGSVPITVIVILIYVGWIVALMVLAQQTLGAVWTGLGTTAGLLLSTALTLTAVVIGYQLILRFNRVMVWLSGLALVTTLVYTGIEAADGGVGELAGAGGSFTWAGFLGMASVVGVWQLPTRRTSRTTRATCPRPPRPGPRSGTPTPAPCWASSERCLSVPSWSRGSARTAGWWTWTASCRTPCSSS